jgi:hypothetical protein
MFLCLSSVVQDTAHRGATDVEPACDFGFAHPDAAQFANLIGMQGGGEGSAQTFTVLAGMSETGPPIAINLEGAVVGYYTDSNYSFQPG